MLSAPPATQDPEIAHLLERVTRASERARALADGLSEAQLRWTPPSGGWGVGQVLEHLVVSGSLYLERMRGAVEGAAAKGKPRGRGWKPSLLGRFLVSGLDPSSQRKLPAPKVFRPASEPRPDVLGAFLGAQDELVDLLRRADGYDVSRIRMASPVSPLLRVNLGDAFRILAVHAERHLGQAERVLAEPGFPR